MLISEIRDEIINEVGQDTTDTGLQTKMLGFIKSALRKLPEAARDKSITTVGSVTITAGSYSASLPLDFLKELSPKSFWYISGDKREVVEKIPRDEFNRTFSGGIVGTPSFCSITGKTLEVDLKASEDMTLYIEYFKSVWNVVATDTFAGLDNLIECVKEFTKFIYYADYEEDTEKGALHLSLARDHADKIKSDFMEEVMGSHVQET